MFDFHKAALSDLNGQSYQASDATNFLPTSSKLFKLFTLQTKITSTTYSINPYRVGFGETECA